MTNKRNIQTKLLQRFPTRGYQDDWMRNRTRSTTDRSKVQLTRRNSYRDFATIHKAIHPSQMNTSGFLQPLCRDVMHPNQQVSIWDIAASCILVAFICFILTGSMNIALLRNHCILNLVQVSVEYSQIPKIIESNLSLKTTRQILTIDSHSNTSKQSTRSIFSVFFSFDK